MVTPASTGPRLLAARLPIGPGVYRFRDERGRALYIGRATNLRRRVGSYGGDLRDRRHLATMVRRIASVEAVACASAHEAAWLERNLLERRLPSWNRAIGGAEVPVYLRLDARPGSAGLRVVHTVAERTGVRHFGPYLGGAKVRLAASALHRMLPVAYTNDGLSATGRDLARVFGVDPGDRESLLAAVSAILDRDQLAVTSFGAALARRRDAAAKELAFEFAGKVQAEIEAIAWVVSEQKVTSVKAENLDVHGWSDGLLVQFEIRDGRLQDWRQRRCGAATARRHLAGTPPAWTAFAQRNAELAARLAGETPADDR